MLGENGWPDTPDWSLQAEQRYRATAGLDDPLPIRAERARCNREALRRTLAEMKPLAEVTLDGRGTN